MRKDCVCVCVHACVIGCTVWKMKMAPSINSTLLITQSFQIIVKSFYKPLKRTGLSCFLFVNSTKEQGVNFLRAAVNVSLSNERLHNISRSKPSNILIRSDRYRPTFLAS
jgi:hypothetical protein